MGLVCSVFVVVVWVGALDEMFVRCGRRRVRHIFIGYR
jgi:hypothetical protein